MEYFMIDNRNHSGLDTTVPGPHFGCLNMGPSAYRERLS